MREAMTGIITIVCFLLSGYSTLSSNGLSDTNMTGVLSLWVSALRFPIFVFDDSQEDAMMELTGIHDNQHRRYLKLNEFESFMRDYMPHVLKTFKLEEMTKHLNFVILCHRHCLLDITQKANELDQRFGVRTLLRHFSTWLFVTNLTLGLHLGGITLDHVTVASQNRHNATPKASTLLWTKTGREWASIDVDNGSIIKTRTLLFPNTKCGMNGRMLTLVSLEWRPFTIRTNSSASTMYLGAGVDGIDALSKVFNFRYTEPADGKWGEKLENGSWTGILGVLQREEADTCPCPFAYNYERFNYIDISTPIATSGYTAIYKRRLDGSSNWFHFIYPFKWQVYVTMIAALVWMTLLALCLSLEYHSSSDVTPLCFSYGACIPFRQEPLYKPTMLSSRILLITWWLFCVIIAAAYSGNLVAFAAVQRIQAPFTSLEDLAYQDQYDIGVDYETFIARKFKTSNDSLFKKLLSKINKTPIPEGYTAGLTYHYSRLNTDNYILLTTLVDWGIFQRDICHIERAKATFFPFHLGYAFPKNSPLLKLFDRELSKFKDRGLFTIWRDRWLPKTKNCSKQFVQLNPTLETEHLYSILMTMTGGIFFASGILVIERKLNDIR